MAELIPFYEHLIMGGYNYAYGIAAADLTGNGVLDIRDIHVTPLLLRLVQDKCTHPLFRSREAVLWDNVTFETIQADPSSADPPAGAKPGDGRSDEDRARDLIMPGVTD